MDTQIAFPSTYYMHLVNGGDLNADALQKKMFGNGGLGVAQICEANNLLGPDKAFLDIGCGCGRVARQLVGKVGSYAGFDRHRGMIEWAQQAFAGHPFRFEHADVASAYDHVYSEYEPQQGLQDASAWRFPYEDDSFDSALAASVFTHMPQPEIENYLRELKRVMKPGGLALVTAMHDEASKLDGFNFLIEKEAMRKATQAAGFAPEYLDHKGAGQHWWLLRA